MGLGGVGIWQLLIVLAIIALVFGTKRLKGVGSDLGGAIKGFKDSLTQDTTRLNQGDFLEDVINEPAEAENSYKS